ncbi:hypothetical protein MUK42_36925, partial [Musa troglodytarum]
SIVVSIPACHAGDPGSIPGNGVSFLFCQKDCRHLDDAASTRGEGVDED